MRKIWELEESERHFGKGVDEGSYKSTLFTTKKLAIKRLKQELDCLKKTWNNVEITKPSMYPCDNYLTIARVASTIYAFKVCSTWLIGEGNDEEKEP